VTVVSRIPTFTHSARVLTTHYRSQHIQANTRRGSI